MNPNIKILEFANQNIPLPIESKNTSDTTFVNWGLNNQYPAFLIDLYNQSSVHSAIINQKANYIIGSGIKDEQNKDIELQVNPSDSLQEFTSKVIKDYLLFNSMAVEVVFNVFGQPVEFYHVPIHKLRMNKHKTKFWYCEDWMYNRKYINYDRYSPRLVSDGTSKLFYFDGYFPSLNNVYPTPEYAGTIKSITTDIAVKEFNLNNIRNHFSPSSIITFFMGSNITDQVKRQTIEEIERNFKGESGKKFIIDFQTKDGKEASIRQLSANDWDKAYNQVLEQNINDIMIGHQVQNPSLFGIKTQGQLGNTQELEVSYEIIKNNYINVKRGEIESAFNQLFLNYEPIKGKVKFGDKPLFNTSLKDETKLRIYTINELRKEAGLAPLADGDRLIDSVTPTVAPVQQEQVEDVKKKPNSQKLTEDDFELIKDLGTSFEEFDIVEEVQHSHQHFSIENDIAKWVVDNDVKNLTLPQLVDVLDKEGSIATTERELERILNKLNEAGVIKVNKAGGKIDIRPNTNPDIPDTDAVTVMYKYIKRPDVSGGDLLPTSRSFCVKLINNNRLYTREEIQSMSSIFGYDIFRFCGGWYYDPETESTTPNCRHQWQMLRVKRRTQG